MSGEHYAMLFGVGLGAVLIVVLAWLDERVDDERVARADAKYRKRQRDRFRAQVPRDRVWP